MDNRRGTKRNSTRVNSREHGSVICEARRRAGYSLDYKRLALARHAPSHAHTCTSPGHGFFRKRVKMKLGIQILPAWVKPDGIPDGQNSVISSVISKWLLLGCSQSSRFLLQARRIVGSGGREWIKPKSVTYTLNRNWEYPARALSHNFMQKRQMSNKIK